MKTKSIIKEASQNIIYLAADSNYTRLFFETGKSELSAKNLAVFCNLLPNSFLRVNRSCTINKLFIKEFNIYDRTILLKNNKEVLISRRRWLQVKQHFLFANI